MFCCLHPVICTLQSSYLERVFFSNLSFLVGIPIRNPLNPEYPIRNTIVKPNPEFIQTGRPTRNRHPIRNSSKPENQPGNSLNPENQPGIPIRSGIHLNPEFTIYPKFTINLEFTQSVKSTWNHYSSSHSGSLFTIPESQFIRNHYFGFFGPIHILPVSLLDSSSTACPVHQKSMGKINTSGCAFCHSIAHLFLDGPVRKCRRCGVTHPCHYESNCPKNPKHTRAQNRTHTVARSTISDNVTSPASSPDLMELMRRN